MIKVSSVLGSRMSRIKALKESSLKMLVIRIKLKLGTTSGRVGLFLFGLFALLKIYKNLVIL